MEERIKEAEHAANEDPAESVGAAPESEKTVKVTPKRSRVTKLIMEMWPAYLIEVLVIILGISITLALEEWRDNSKEDKLASVYLKNLKSDIEADLQTLRYAAENTQVIINRGNELLEFANGPSTALFPPAKIDSDLQSILHRPNFISRDATFSDLKSSGNLHLLKDIQLKNLLFAYYSLTQNIKEVQDAERQATIVISAPYFLRKFPLGKGANRAATMTLQEQQALAKDIEFGNNVLLRVENRKELLEDYQRAAALAGKINSLAQ